MRKYWSCSQIADWVRGTKEPKLATLEQWEQWEVEAKAAHPIRFWIAETALDNIRRILTRPYAAVEALRIYITNRFGCHIHALTANREHLVRGKYYDLDYRLVVCIFDEFVRFIDGEAAAMMIDDHKQVPLKNRLPVIRWFTEYNNPEQGLAFITSQASEVYSVESGLSDNNPLVGSPTQSAIVWKQLLNVYLWYKNEYPCQKTADELSGYSAHVAQYGHHWSRNVLSHKLAEERRQLAKIRDRIEQEQYDQVTEHLTTILRYRTTLWT